MAKDIVSKAHDKHPSRFNERRFWTEFLILYRSQPALWDLNDERYKDKSAKIKGYTLLTQKLTELEPNATRNDVLRRINIFRTNYRRERVRSITHRDRGQNYETTLWYFNLLSFLEPQMHIKTLKRPDSSKLKEHKSIQKLCDQVPYENSEQVEYIVYENDKNDISKTCSALKKRQKLERVSFKYENNHTSADINDEEESFEYFEDETNKIHESQKINVGVENNIISCEHEDSEYVDEIHNENYKEMQSNNVDFEENLAKMSKQSEYEVTDDEVTNGHVEKNIESTSLQYGIEHQSPSSTSTLNSKEIQLRTFTPLHQIHSNTNMQISTAGEILARSWALQYDEMSSQQKIFARKAIADILFEGCMGTLGTNQS